MHQYWTEIKTIFTKFKQRSNGRGKVAVSKLKIFEGLMITDQIA